MNIVLRIYLVVALVVCGVGVAQADVFYTGITNVNGSVAGGSLIMGAQLGGEDAGASYNNGWITPAAFAADPLNAIGRKTTALGAVSLTSAQVNGVNMGLGTGSFGLLAIYALEGVIGPNTSGPGLRNNFEPGTAVPGGTLPGGSAGGVVRVYDRSSLPDSFDANDPASWVPSLTNLSGPGSGLVAELVVTPKATPPGYLKGDDIGGFQTTSPAVGGGGIGAVNTFIIDTDDAFQGSEGDIKLNFTDLFSVGLNGDAAAAPDGAGGLLPSLFKNFMVDPADGPFQDPVAGLGNSLFDILLNLDQEQQDTNFPDFNGLDVMDIDEANALFDGLLDAAFGAGDYLFSDETMADLGFNFDNFPNAAVGIGNNALATGLDTGLINAGGIWYPGGQFRGTTTPEPASILAWLAMMSVGGVVVAVRKFRNGKCELR